MNILALILFSRRPASLPDMQATVSRFWCRRGYQGITLFGHIFTRSEEEARRFNLASSKTGGGWWVVAKNHEMIHLRQAQSTCNSWLLFYVRYLWYSLLACRYNRRMKKAGYYLNPFEIEAYTHENDLGYLDGCGKKGAIGWRKYAQMSLAERLRHVEALRIEN